MAKDKHPSLFGPAFPPESPEAQELERRMAAARADIETDKKRDEQTMAESTTPIVESMVVPSTIVARAMIASDMHPTALVFLEDPIARKLAVAWASCGGQEDAWLSAAGLGESYEAKRISKALRINGVCRDGGVTDAKALAYIAAIVAEPLQKRLKGNHDKRNT